jgi:hypothetical protein
VIFCDYILKNGRLIEFDIRRQKEIEEYQGCKFIRIKDKESYGTNASKY